MKSLETKIPPPVLAGVVALFMTAAAPYLQKLELPFGLQVALMAGCGVIAFSFGITGVITFLRKQTTIDPVNVDQASKLVTDGIYAFSRNPMYVGLTALLVQWAVHLSVPWTLVGPAVFAWFLHRFQIIPEERAMRAKFGAAYDDYCRRVRRWL